MPSSYGRLAIMLANHSLSCVIFSSGCELGSVQSLTFLSHEHCLLLDLLLPSTLTSIFSVKSQVTRRILVILRISLSIFIFLRTISFQMTCSVYAILSRLGFIYISKVFNCHIDLISSVQDAVPNSRM